MGIRRPLGARRVRPNLMSNPPTPCSSACWNKLSISADPLELGVLEQTWKFPLLWESLARFWFGGAAMPPTMFPFWLARARLFNMNIPERSFRGAERQRPGKKHILLYTTLTPLGSLSPLGF